MLKALQKRTKRADLSEALMSSTPARVRLAGDDAHRPALQAPETDHDIGGKLRLDLQEILIVHDARDHIAHVIDSLVVHRNNPVHLRIGFDAAD